MINKIKEIIAGIDSKNMEYILSDAKVESDIRTALSFYNDGNKRMFDFMLEGIADYAKSYDQLNITPLNAKVGDGVTMHLYSDAYAGTIVKVTKTTITVQRDIATLDADWKPEFVVGGFAGHCTNQNTQKYTYEKNPTGEIMRFTWSKKDNRYKNTKASRKISKGRHEFYDYNF